MSNVNNYEYFVKLGLWSILEHLIRNNDLKSVNKSKLASYVWEVSSGSHFKRCERSLIQKDWQQCWLAINVFNCLYKNVDYSDCEFLSADSLEENIKNLQEELHFRSLIDTLEQYLSLSAKKI